LAEAYLAAGDRERAAANYKKVMQLNPADVNAKTMLRRLTEGK
jgi:hypothetical protein